MRHETELSVMLLDIDHFKGVNDNFGHPVGDQVRKEVCSVAQRELRAEDLMARYGGEEFALLVRATPRSGAARLAERIREAVAAHIVIASGEGINVTLSAGCATLSCLETRSPERLVELADRRLYIAKNGGRNRVVSDGGAPSTAEPE
jgi:diguanylate cyclase (GGDEF)-like protein